MGGIAGALFGEKPKIEQGPTAFETLPDFAQQGFETAVGRGQDLFGSVSPFVPLPFNPVQASALRDLSTIGTRGTGGPKPLGFTKLAQRSFKGAEDVLGGVGDIIQQGINPITGEEIETGIGQFFNPFTEQVVDTSIQDILEDRARQQSDISSLASQAGAFGGTRQALLESELGRTTQRNIGDIGGRLRTAGFEAAANRALQNLLQGRNRFLQGAQTTLGQAQGLESLGRAGLAGRQINIAGDVAQRAQNLADLQGRLAAGNVLQQPALQQQQIAQQQLRALQGSLQGIPSGGGQFQQTEAGSQGLFGGGGNIGSGLGNVFAAFGF